MDKSIWPYSLVAVMIVGTLVASLAMTTMIAPEQIAPTGDGKDGASWNTVWEGPLNQLGAEANPGAGAGGILEVFFINHSAGNTYSTRNTSVNLEAWCDSASLGYASADDFSTDIAHSTNFDIIVRVRGNRTQCYRTDAFHPTDLRVNITMGLGGATLQAMTLGITHNDSAREYLWCNFYLDNGGAGYTIAKDNTTTINEIKFQAYY